MSTVARVVAPRSLSSLPTRLRPADLLRLTDEGAADVLDGYYDDVLPAEWPNDARWSRRLTGDGEVELWLIGWVPERSAQLHDHGGSLGALTVLSGSLREVRWDGTGLATRRLDAGDQAAFPLGWVHDVMRHPSATDHLADPTLSVHAYSPPLTVTSFYDISGDGVLRRTGSELTRP